MRNLHFTTDHVASGAKGLGGRPDSQHAGMRRSVGSLVLACLFVVGGLFSAGNVYGQSESPFTGGFDIKAPATVTTEERMEQPDMWVLEVDCKPMRLIWVDLTDPATGEKKRELVWYLVYRVVNRPIPKPEDNSDTVPENVKDTPLSPPYFVPEFTLLTQNTGGPHLIYSDVVIPEAHAAIVERERFPYKNSVEIVGPIPEITPYESNTVDALYGVAMWRGVDPDTDYFTLFLDGFSDGYKIGEGPDAEPMVLRKTLMLKFWYPGDRFNHDERRFVLRDEPEWIYRPERSDEVADFAPFAADDDAAPADEENSADEEDSDDEGNAADEEDDAEN